MGRSIEHPPRSQPVTDIWFCPSCHSVNRQRDKRCYKCHTPQDAASGPGLNVRIQAAIANRTVARYRSTRLLALMTIGLILALTALATAIVVAGLADLDWQREQITNIVNGGTPNQAEILQRSERLASADLARLMLGVATLIFFAAWLSRAIANIPALGGGRMARSPARAFIYTLIPVWNLLKVPGMIQEVLYRVEPRAGGFFMVFIAWFGIVGSWLVAFFGGLVIGFHFVSELLAAGTTGERVAAVQGYFDQVIALEVLTAIFVAGGAAVLVLLMIRIEWRSAARDREIRAALQARLFGPATPDPLPAVVD